ncbi:MAG TPA: hypothetical protein VI895_07365 [Bdellovibrionota bacterium]|nr:hypothetical protein [Bdellovibrionota bacterium]
MISLYTINYPAAACVLMLIGVLLYHLLMSRRQEIETATFPAGLEFLTGDQLFSLSTNQDLAVNCEMSFDRLTCRRLYVGPDAILSGKVIEATQIIAEGTLQNVQYIRAEEEIVIKQVAVIGKVDSPRLVLGKRAVATIQVVPAATRVIMKRGAQSRGFFGSIEELEKARLLANRRISTLRKSREEIQTSKVSVLQPQKRA